MLSTSSSVRVLEGLRRLIKSVSMPQLQWNANGILYILYYHVSCFFWGGGRCAKKVSCPGCQFSSLHCCLHQIQYEKRTLVMTGVLPHAVIIFCVHSDIRKEKPKIFINVNCPLLFINKLLCILMRICRD